jgi:hypothetical protein
MHNIGRIGLDHARLVDIGGIGIKMGCNCDEEITKNKLYLAGERITVNCHKCFNTVNAAYMGLKFHNPTIKQFQIEDEK